MKRIVAIILFLSCMLCLCACNIAYAGVENTAFSGLLQLHGEDTTTDGDSTPLVTIPEAGENTDIPAGEQSVQNPDEIPGNDQETPENTNDDSDTPYEIPNGQEDYQEQPVDYNLGLPNGVDSLEEFISLYARQMEEISSSLSENSMEIGYESVGVGEENIKPPFYCDKVMFACHPSPEGGMKPEETELLVKLFQFNSDEGEIYYQSDMEVTWYEFDGVDQYSSFDSFTEGKNYLLSVDFTVPVHCTLLDDVIVGLNNNAVRAEIRESERIISIRYYIMNFGSDGGFCSVRFENVPENDVRPYTRQSYATQIIATHNLPLLVDDPELEGFHFSGWFSDETMTRAFSFDDVIDEDTTIYAKWSADAPSVELLLGDVEASEKAVLPELMTDADVIVSAIGWSDTENGEPDYEGSLKAAQTYWLSGKICPTQTGVVWKENEFTVRVNGQAVASGLSETGTEIDFACPVVIQDKEHGHSIIYHEPVSAECENDGVMEYWECEKCGELFANEDLTVQISEDKLIIKATGHEETSPVRENEVPATCMKEGSYDEVIYCSVCNRELSRKKQTTEMAPHSPGELIVENRIDSTETMEGSYEEVTYCTVCNKELGREKKIIPRKTHIHNLVKVSAVGASCSKTGNIEHYVCLSCGQKFADEQGTRQIYNVVTQEKGHSWGEWRTTIAATANYEGRRERICGVCGQTEYESIPRLQSTSSGGSGSSGNYSYQGSGTSYINSGSSSGTNSTQQSQNSSVVSKTQNPATNNEYKFLEGGNATWKKGSEEGLHIMTSSIAKKLTSVYIDGNLLQVKNYKTNGTAENMNKPSEITLLPAVLETLDEGEHDIEIRYSDGKAVSKLIIKEKDPEPSPTPAPTTSPTATPTISPSPTVSPEPTTPSDGETDPAAKQVAAKKSKVSKVMIPLVLIACTVLAGGLILYMNQRGVNLEDVFDSVKRKIRKN